LFGNSFHLVTTTGTTATAVLDGFVIAAGDPRARATRMAAAARVTAGGPTVRNCRFVKPLHVQRRGYIGNGAAPSFSDCG
jgi:hypothetical protein